jgi:hypothetical protein
MRRLPTLHRHLETRRRFEVMSLQTRVHHFQYPSDPRKAHSGSTLSRLLAMPSSAWPAQAQIQPGMVECGGEWKLRDIVNIPYLPWSMTRCGVLRKEMVLVCKEISRSFHSPITVEQELILATG